MKYGLNDKVKTQNMDDRYNNRNGKVVEIFPNLRSPWNVNNEPVYMVEYDVPFGNDTQGMFKESDLAYQK